MCFQTLVMDFHLPLGVNEFDKTLAILPTNAIYSTILYREDIFFTKCTLVFRQLPKISGTFHTVEFIVLDIKSARC